MSLQAFWFVLWGVLWAAYFALDGFDLGAGMLHGILGRTGAGKSAIRRSIGPVWDGNEVWLVAAGGVTFAAFPTAYALMFSFLYWPWLIILFALIFRGAALEFRSKLEGAAWARTWDAVLALASFVPALLFGVVFGNIFRGLPIDASGYHGTLLSLLNPYGLLTGALFVLIFSLHGALWIAMKTSGDLGARALRKAGALWTYLLIAAAGFLVSSHFSTGLARNYFESPAWLAVPILAVAALAGTRLMIGKKNATGAFLASGATIVLFMATGLVGLYPNLLPSRLDSAFGLTIFNASSSPGTLKIMSVVVLVFVPVAIAYQAWVYRVFRHKTDAGEDPGTGY
jgi:cytochrome d ubiquinol oxidase subunit II